MSRDDGFAVADIDSGYFDDAKMRALWFAIQDANRMARAMCLHSATLLASWRQGVRVTVTQAIPLWLAADADLVAALKVARLLDRYGKIPAASWQQWFGTAYDRRERYRSSGRAGGLQSARRRELPGENPPKRAQRRSGDAGPTPEQTSSGAGPVRPSVRPSVPTGRDEPGDDLSDVLQWLAKERSVSVPEGKAMVELARLLDQHGKPAVIAALARQDPSMRDGRQYVFGAMKDLNPFSDRRNGHRGDQLPPLEEAERAFEHYE